MHKNKLQPSEPEVEPSSEKSDNLNNNVKYIKKLELQRLILNKIVKKVTSQNSSTSSLDPEGPDIC